MLCKPIYLYEVSYYLYVETYDVFLEDLVGGEQYKIMLDVHHKINNIDRCTLDLLIVLHDIQSLLNME